MASCGGQLVKNVHNSLSLVGWSLKRACLDPTCLCLLRDYINSHQFHQKVQTGLNVSINANAHLLSHPVEEMESVPLRSYDLA